MKIVYDNIEEILFEKVKLVKGNSGSYHSIHFNLHALNIEYKSAFQQKIVVNLLNDIFRKSLGDIFILRDGDIIVFYDGDDVELLSRAVFELRYLFADDPLAYNSDGSDNVNFSTIYNLSYQWRPFYRMCAELMELSNSKNVPEEIGDDEENQSLLTPLRLVEIVREINNVDFNLVTRKQPICAIKEVQKGASEIEPRIVYNEMYVNIAHLNKIISTDIDFTSNKWLFRYLTDILDANVISLLQSRTKAYIKKPLSINLNVQSVLSQEFNVLSDIIDGVVGVKLVVEIDIADVFTNMNEFLKARDIIQARGYRLCLDGLSTRGFVQVDRESLGFDLAKIRWNADMVGDLSSDENRKLARSIKKCGPNRIILCRCDTSHAIDYGHALGVSLFQGRYPDKIVNPDSNIEN